MEMSTGLHLSPGGASIRQHIQFYSPNKRLIFPQIEGMEANRPRLPFRIAAERRQATREGATWISCRDKRGDPSNGIHNSNYSQ